MIASHVKVFLNAAEELSCKILVRETNRLMNRWIDKPAAGHCCIPKPVECKAKTADNELSQLGGLVVDPTLVPDAFKDARAAEKTWFSFTKLTQDGTRVLPSCFDVVQHGAFRGAVIYRNSERYPGSAFIHSDYDLMAVVEMRNKGSDGLSAVSRHYQVTGSDRRKDLSHNRNSDLKHILNLESEVEKYVNKHIGIPMIQHGSEFTYWDVGAASRENVLCFEPGNKLSLTESSFPGADLHQRSDESRAQFLRRRKAAAN